MSQFIEQLLRARIAGHPIHSMLVHFPSALFPMAVLFDIISVCINNHCLSCAAFYCYGGGLILGLVAACAGAVDYTRLPPSHPAWNKASLHALLNIIWIILFSIVFGLKLKSYPAIEFATPAELIISIIGVIGLIFSNFLGGDLVFRHKLGIDDTNSKV